MDTRAWKRRSTYAAAAAAVVLLTQGDAYGCVCSRLIYMQMMTAFIANIFFGFLEALVAVAVFRVRTLKAIGLMVPANVFAAFAALPFLRALTEAVAGVFVSGPRILNLDVLWYTAVAVAFPLTILFEIPFCWLLVRGRPHALYKAAAFAVLSQAVTYGFLAYGIYKPVPILRDAAPAERVDARVLRNPDALLYYLENKAGNLVSMRLDGTQQRTVCRGVEDEFARLIPGKDANGEWRVAVFRKDGEVTPQMLPAPATPPEYLAEHCRSAWAEAFEIARAGGWIQCIDLRTDWRARYYHSAYIGSHWSMSVCHRDSDANSSSSDSDRYHYQTPFEVMTWHALTVLPGDEAVVQVDRQILVIDLRNRRISFLAEGHSPLVIPCGKAAPRAADAAGETPVG